MKARLLAGSLSVAVLASCNFPGYSSKVEAGTPTTEFVKGDKKDLKPKLEVSTDGNSLQVKAMSDVTCYGSNVTTTPQKRIYSREGVDPLIGVGIGVASAALFGVTFASGICDPDDPRLFDFNKNDGGVDDGIPTSQTTCDFVTAGGTLVGFSGALAYGATSVKVLTTKPEDEMLDPEQKSSPITQACGTEPLANEPILIFLKEDRSASYAWTDAEGKAKFDLGTLIDPSVQGGLEAAFARDSKNIMAFVTDEQMKSLRPEGWSAITKTPPTGEAQLLYGAYKIEDVNEDVRRLTLSVKVKNTSSNTIAPGPVSLRAKLVSKDSAGVNGRTILWEGLPLGEESEKTITIDLPKALPDPAPFDIYLISKAGTALTKVTAINGPPPAVAPTPTPAASTLLSLSLTGAVKFTAGLSTLDKSANAVLDAAAKEINTKPEYKVIRVEGHTDEKGADAKANEKLSADRAAAVVKYLTTTGKVDPKRLVSKGYGAGCPTDDKTKNTRVELVVLGEKDEPQGECRAKTQK